MSRIILFFFCCIPLFVGMSMATQAFAEKVLYDVNFLGTPLIEMGGTHFYTPWKCFEWYIKYRQYVPEFFTGLPFYILGGFLFTLLFLYMFKPKKVMTSHGSSHWAEYKDISQMELFSTHGVIIGLYDPAWKRGMTQLLHKLNNIRSEKVSFAEMAYDQKLSQKIDLAAQRLDYLKEYLEDNDEDLTDEKRERLEKAAEKLQSFIEKPPKYDAKKMNRWTVYPFVWLHKKYLSLYVRLPTFYLRDNSNKHLAVIAPTRSGKGVGLIVPTLLQGWNESVIVNDIKSENWGITSGARKRMGQKVIKFEPTADDGSTARWNPLDEIKIGDPMEVSMAQNLADVLADREGKGKMDHWGTNASNVIMVVILYLKYAHALDPEGTPNPNLYTVASFMKVNTMPSAPPDESQDKSKESQDDDGSQTGQSVANLDPDAEAGTEEESMDTSETKGQPPPPPPPTDGGIDVKGFIDTMRALMFKELVPKEGLRLVEWNTKKCKYEERLFTQEDLAKMYPYATTTNTPGMGGIHPIIMQAFAEITSKPDNELGSIISTANTALKEYLDPILSQNTAVSDFCIDDLMNYKQPVSLYLVTPPSDLLRLAPIFRLFFELMVRHHARSIGEYKNGQAKSIYKHKCLFLMDEFSSLGNLQSFAATLAYIAGYGMKAFLINQGLPQINGIYGKDNQILMNCHIKIFYAPNDNDTGKYAEALLGNQTITVENISDNSSGGLFSKKSVSRSQTGRALMTADELSRLGDQEIIKGSGSPPILTEKVKYYEQKYFTSRLIDAPYVSDVIREDEVFNAYPARKARLAEYKRKRAEESKIDFTYTPLANETAERNHHESEHSETNKEARQT